MELNKIYCESNLDTMSRMPDNFIDLTVTSPPYDGLRVYNGYSFPFQGIAKELFRVTKEGGVVVWNVGDSTVNGSESLTSFKQAIYFVDECGFNLHDTMIYQKENPVPTGGNNRYYQEFEYMFILSKGTPKTFNPIIQKRRNKHKDKRTERTKGFTRDTEGNFHKKLVPLNENVKLGNVWMFTVGGGNSTSDDIAFKHPAIFPEQMAADHIESWSNEGDLVYDPFCGSGTTPKMSHLQSRKWVASEISDEYVAIANKRLLPYLTQTNLFKSA